MDQLKTKIMKQKELYSKAQQIMQKYNVEYCYATADGNIFLPGKKSAADFHAKNTKQSIQRIERIAEEKVLAPEEEDQKTETLPEEEYQKTETTPEEEYQKKSYTSKNHKK